MTTHFSFTTQLAKGEEAERFLDSCFTDRFEIRPVSRTGQRRGIDRIFKNEDTGKEERVEYKTDWRAHETHNAFIETVSVDTEQIRGWAWTTQADVIFYYVPVEELVYVLQPSVIRELLPRWEACYRTGKARNQTYFTHGILVPLDELEQCAREVISL